MERRKIKVEFIYARKGNSKREAAIEIIRTTAIRWPRGCPMNLTMPYAELCSSTPVFRLFSFKRCSHFVCHLRRRSETYPIDAADRYPWKRPFDFRETARGTIDNFFLVDLRGQTKISR